MKQQHVQSSQYNSPWSVSLRIKMLVWEYVWLILCSWTPKPANRWRLLWLMIFGCKIYGKPFVHQRARIQIPWNLILHDHACLGDRANAYTLGVIEIFEHATVGQEVYLCTGTHAFNKPEMNLITSKITINKNAFLGVRAVIMPGITIGENAIIGAGSLVTKNVEKNTIVGGNPAQYIKNRTFE